MFHSFPEKLRKIVATRGEIFSLKFTKYCLAAGLRPDPLGQTPYSHNKGGASSKGREREGRGRRRGELQGVRGDRRPW